jgi:DNA repair exonuclease SbcCD ATPase subunit
MKLLNGLKQIVCFPIQNDNRAIGLIKNYRDEINELKTMKGEGGVKYEQKITNLEKRLVNENMNKLSFIAERKAVLTQLKELKEKYNEMVRQKAEVQQLLLKAEEEKLALSQSVMQLQIDNAKLEESLHLVQIDKHAEDLDEVGSADKLRNEYSAAKKTVKSLKDKLALALNEKRDIETEFMSLKKNYIDKCKELEAEKTEVDELKLQLVKSGGRQRGYNAEHGAKVKNDIIKEMELEKLKKQLEETLQDLNKARNDRAHMELYVTKLKLQIEGRNLQSDSPSSGRVEELLEWKTRCKRVEREIEELNIDLKNLAEEKVRLEETNKLLMKDLDTTKRVYREELKKTGGRNIENLLVRSLSDGEEQLKKLIQDLTINYIKQRQVSLQLKKRVVQLKNICEDLMPKGSMRLSILDEEEPAVDINEANTFLLEFNEYENLKKGYEQLKEENEILKSKLSESKVLSGDEAVQQKILQEVKALKRGKYEATNEEYERIKREHVGLLEENRRLKIIVRLI